MRRTCALRSPIPACSPCLTLARPSGKSALRSRSEFNSHVYRFQEPAAPAARRFIARFPHSLLTLSLSGAIFNYFGFAKLSLQAPCGCSTQACAYAHSGASPGRAIALQSAPSLGISAMFSARSSRGLPAQFTSAGPGVASFCLGETRKKGTYGRSNAMQGT